MIDETAPSNPSDVQARVLQVGSTFTSRPLAKTLRAHLADAGVADAVEFVEYGKVAEYLLAPSSEDQRSLGTLVLVRVEDWLRSELKNSSGSDVPALARQKLTTHTDEFVKQIKSLAQRGRPVWLIACNSNGWIAESHQLAALCRTYTNLLLARVRGTANITVLNWPSSLANPEVKDLNTDRLGQIPFTREAFDELGRYLGTEIETALATKAASASPASLNGKADLAKFLASLEVRVALVRAEPADRAHVDRILRTAAAFSLTGENRDLTDSEVDSLIATSACMLVSVSDRLSQYGPSGVLSFRVDGDALVIEALALSCPVLGKQVEFAVFSGLARMAGSQGCARIVFGFRASGRNQIMSKFLESMAHRTPEGQFMVDVSEIDDKIRNTAVTPGAWTLEFRE